MPKGEITEIDRNMGPDITANLKYAQITSAEVETNFSVYKTFSILGYLNTMGKYNQNFSNR